VGRVDVHAGAGFQHQHRGEADEQRQDSQAVEQAQRLAQRRADLAGVGQRRDAADDGAEDDGGDHHFDDSDEHVAEHLEVGAEVWEEVPDGDAEDHADEDLDVEKFQQFHDLHGDASLTGGGLR
jgi:hypothetical protein